MQFVRFRMYGLFRRIVSDLPGIGGVTSLLTTVRSETDATGR